MAHTSLSVSSSPFPPRSDFMRTRHRPLIRLYRQEPEAAWIEDRARTVRGASKSLDPVHSMLSVGSASPVKMPVSIHSAVGGDHDGPNPGDYLCAALVGCLDTTMRIVADRLGVELVEVEIDAKAGVDVRGTLYVDPSVPVAFQRIGLSLHARAVAGTPDAMLVLLVETTKHSCVVYQTLRKGVDIHFSTDVSCVSAPEEAAHV